MAYRSTFGTALLRLFLGCFFLILGISVVFQAYGLDQSIFGIDFNQYWLQLTFGIVEILCGLLILLGFFLFNDDKSVQWGSLIAFIFWVTRIVLTRFIWGMTFLTNSGVNWPHFFRWGLILSCELIIASALLVLMRRHD